MTLQYSLPVWKSRPSRHLFLEAERDSTSVLQKKVRMEMHSIMEEMNFVSVSVRASYSAK